jgi:hypothetical protein
MAIVQISFQDNANNETGFKVYRGSSSPLTASSTQIAQIDLVSGSWVASETSTGSAPSLQLTSTNTGDSNTTGETFVITYDEGTSGNYFFGVSATNAVGDSDIVTTSSQLSVS